MRAYAEWIPVRGQTPENPSYEGSHRTFAFGDLATLILVENRISHRDRPLDLTATDFYEAVAKRPIKDWVDDDIQRARDDLRKQLKDPSRHMLGSRQVEDVGAAVSASVAAGQPWQFFLSQTVFGRLKAPRLLETLPLQPRILRAVSRGALKVATSDKIAGPDAAQLARTYLGLGRYGVEMNPGAWDGFQAERKLVLNAFDVPEANPIVLAGDSHNAWAQELLQEDTGRRIGVVSALIPVFESNLLIGKLFVTHTPSVPLTGVRWPCGDVNWGFRRHLCAI